MDRRERLQHDIDILLKAALDGWQSEIWTGGPAIVQAYDPVKMTADVQMAVQVRVRKPNGDTYWVSIPKLVDCPVKWPGGGGYLMTFPLEKGDEVLVAISHSCIDGWWESGGIQQAPDLRMHDLSDGFVLPRIWSKPNSPGASTTKVQIRSNDSATLIELGGGVVNVISPNPMQLTTPELRVTGDLITGFGTAEQMSMGHFFSDIYDLHKHGGVTTGSDESDVPTIIV